MDLQAEGVTSDRRQLDDGRHDDYNPYVKLYKNKQKEVDSSTG